MASNRAAIIPPPGAENAAVTNDIRPIKPPVEIPTGYAWIGWLLLLVAVAVATYYIWRWWQNRPLKEIAAPAIPPHIRARQRLEAALGSISDPRLFCILVSDALRIYLEERFRLHAPERTTEEFLLELQSTSTLNEMQKTGLADFLTRCDLVKFARYEPNEESLRDLHSAALRLIDETRYDPITRETGAIRNAEPPALTPQA